MSDLNKAGSTGHAAEEKEKLRAVESEIQNSVDNPARSVTGTVMSKAVQGFFGGGWNSIFVAIVLALVFRTFLFAAYKIPSGSMIPTLLIGDQLIVNKVSYGIRIPFADTKVVNGKSPARGDIMVFRYPQDPSIDFIKRVIGVPGDVVRIQGHDVWVNGNKLHKEEADPFTYKMDATHSRSAVRYYESHGGRRYQVLYDPLFGPTDEVEYQVPEGMYFMMGDNRDRSNDSRGWGYVPAENFIGSPVVLHFSWDSIESGIRFDRMMHSIE